MPGRDSFTSGYPAVQGVGGNNNLGVFVVRHCRTNKKYIEKRVRPSAIRQGIIQREIRAMEQCNGHPNVISVFRYDLEHKNVGYGSVYLQHAELGSVDRLIQRFIEKDTWIGGEGFAWKIMWDISLALCYLWTGRDALTVSRLASSDQPITVSSTWNPIIHRDIKPSNLFLTWRDPLGVNASPYPTVVLGDFGCAVFGNEIRSATVSVDTIPGNDRAFAPPESPTYSEQSDVYSLALVVICVAWRRQEPPRDNFFRNNWASKGMARVLYHCLRTSGSNRPTPLTLPAVVWKGYKTWLDSRPNYGRPLPGWAFPS